MSKVEIVRDVSWGWCCRSGKECWSVDSKWNLTECKSNARKDTVVFTKSPSLNCKAFWAHYLSLLNLIDPSPTNKILKLAPLAATVMGARTTISYEAYGDPVVPAFIPMKNLYASHPRYKKLSKQKELWAPSSSRSVEYLFILYSSSAEMLNYFIPSEAGFRGSNERKKSGVGATSRLQEHVESSSPENYSFLDREINFLRSPVSINLDGHSAEDSGSGGVDLLLFNNEEKLFVIGEYKSKGDTDLFYALMQALYYASLISTENQKKRLKKVYGKWVGDERFIEIALLYDECEVSELEFVKIICNSIVTHAANKWIKQFSFMKVDRCASSGGGLTLLPPSYV